MTSQRPKRKGQNFLVDRDIIGRIADYASLCPGDRVLEIGPGTGNLTEVLSERAGQVCAVEVDPALAMGLRGRFRNVQIINGDALKVDLGLADYNKIVSNLPYQISSKITYRLLSRPFDLAVLMYQKEFARRMTTRPGSEEYGRLAMTAQFLCHIEIMEIVPRSAFRPEPEVSSAIVRLMPRLDKPAVDVKSFIKLVEGLFNNRRKKIRKVLAAMGTSKERIAGVDAGLLDKRPEELMPDEAARLIMS